MTSARPRGKTQPLTSEQFEQMAEQNMRAHFLALLKAGRTRARSPEEFYGFQPQDVMAVHLHKQGFGSGVWFRLTDGRVIDAYGKLSHPELYWYMSSAH